MNQLLLQEEIKKKVKGLETPKEVVKDQIINEDFVMNDDLRDWTFKEDNKGRYRERIIEVIEKIGVEKWFKLKKYPTNDDSVWKNRYTGTLITLGEEIYKKEVITCGKIIRLLKYGTIKICLKNIRKEQKNFMREKKKKVLTIKDIIENHKNKDYYLRKRNLKK